MTSKIKRKSKDLKNDKKDDVWQLYAVRGEKKDAHPGKDGNFHQKPSQTIGQAHPPFFCTEHSVARIHKKQADENDDREHAHGDQE